MRLRLRFAEHTIGSLKKTLPLHGGLCRKNRSFSYNPDFKEKLFERMDLRRRNLRQIQHPSILYSKPLEVYKKPKLNQGKDHARLTSQERIQATFHTGSFSKSSTWLPMKKLPIYTMRAKKEITNCFEKCPKSCLKSPKNRIVYYRDDFYCGHTADCRPDAKFSDKIFTGAAESGIAMGGFDLGKPVPINVLKCYRGKNSCFLNVNLESLRIFYLSGAHFFTLPLRIICYSNRDQSTAKVLSQSKLLDEHKKLRFILRGKDLVLHSLVQT